MKFLWKDLYARLDILRGQEGISWRKFAKEYHIPCSTFTRISQGKPVSVENLIKFLRIGNIPFEAYVKGKR